MSKNVSNSANAEPTVSTHFLQQDWLPYTPTLPEDGHREKRRIYSKVHLAAVFTSLLCLALGIVSVTPSLSIAWRLRSSGQIVVIGFLLGVMNICLQTVLAFTFLLIEMRFGRSRIQNLEAITTGKITAPGVGVSWRITLFGLLMLPLGLSVAYKRFLGGTIGMHFAPTSTGRYGISLSTGVRGEEIGNDFQFLSMTYINAFRATASSGDSAFPKNFPAAYGYNTLLLSSNAVAILDMPGISHVTDLQSKILPSDSVDILVSVGAYQAVYNDSTTALRNDDNVWSDLLRSKYAKGRLESLYLYDSTRVGYMISDDNQHILFTLHYPANGSDPPVMSYEFTGNYEPLERFRKWARMYTVTRANCRGYWRINTTSISLLDGNCDGSTANSSVLKMDYMTLFPVETLPTISRMSPKLSLDEQKLIYFDDLYAADKDSMWSRAVYAATIATSYWARGHGILSDHNIDLTYAPADEKMVIYRQVLRAEWLLYLVFSVQPALTVLGFVVAVWLSKTAINKDFGIVSVLSRLTIDGLKSLQEVGPPGKSKRPLRLTVEPKSGSSIDDPSDLDGIENFQYSFEPESGPGKERSRR